MNNTIVITPYEAHVELLKCRYSATMAELTIKNVKF